MSMGFTVTAYKLQVAGLRAHRSPFGIRGSKGADLACIAHKSLEICERCRLRQRNSPATPENSAAKAWAILT
jgi:hypothetical protein